jgi:hypothetical protein
MIRARPHPGLPRQSDLRHQKTVANEPPSSIFRSDE